MSRHHDSGSIAVTLASSGKTIHTNTASSTLATKARNQANIQTTNLNVIMAYTGKFTGRSAGDKFIVEDQTTKDTVWWSNTNAMSVANFDVLLADMMDSLNEREIFRQQLFAGAEPKSRYNIDVWSPSAWHALFIRTLLINPSPQDIKSFVANVSVVHLPEFEADPARHGSKTTTCIALDFTRNIVLICGTVYAGEIKKAIFSLFNFHAPDQNILPMHCSANVSSKGESTLFFGLSGTGKTTLSTAPERALIGDDEHGWSTSGIFNLEGGCYAKAINLTKEQEPEIYHAAQHPHAIMENVVRNPQTGEPDFADQSLTENTRIAYPLEAISNRVVSGCASAPTNIVLLTADAFGVLPPIARLTHEQAIYYFLSGYTAKLAGTERGITEPVATFSACFGAPFMARHPSDYGQLLAERLAQSNANCWLLNTGWIGGAYGVGQRISLSATRTLLEAALSGDLDQSEYRTDKLFNLSVPKKIAGIDADLLQPEKTWADRQAYSAAAQNLADLFSKNFSRLNPVNKT